MGRAANRRRACAEPAFDPQTQDGGEDGGQVRADHHGCGQPSAGRRGRAGLAGEQTDRAIAVQAR